MATEFKIFLSHSVQDSEAIVEIRKALKGLGVRTYLAEEDKNPGASVSRKIENHIKASSLFLLLISSNSGASPFVNQEIGFAKSSKKRILPIIIDDSYPSRMISDIEYIRVELTDKRLFRKKVRQAVRSIKTEMESRKAAVVTGAAAAIVYGPEILDKLASSWQEMRKKKT